MENTFEEPSDKVKEAVSLPAILLMISAALGLAMALFILLFTTDAVLRSIEGMNLPAQSRASLESIRNQPASGRLFYVFQAVLSIFVFVGALQMKSLKNYWLAVVAVIVGCIPCCGPCFGCFSLPLGVWALIVLLGNDEVKKAFR
jgi:hypothetical protein